MTTTRSKKLFLLVLVGMALFTAARLAAFIIYRETFGGYPVSDIAAAFLRGLRFDGAIFFTFMAVFFALLLLPIKNALYHKVITWLMFPVYLFMGGFLLSDVIYFGYAGRHMANEPFTMGADVCFLFDMMISYYMQVIIAGVIIIVFAFFYKKLADIKITPEKSYKHYIAVFLIWSGAIFLVIRGTVSDKPINTIDAFVSGDSNLGNLTLNGLFSTTKYFSQQSRATSSDYTFFDDKTAHEILAPYLTLPCSYPEEITGKRPNIVFILLESWSAYYVDSYGGGGFGLTPEFDALSEKGIKFTRHYAPDKRSISAIQASLTGIPPMAGLPSLGFGLETLAKGNVGKLLTENGYETVFIQSSRRRSFYMDAIAKSLGFKEYYGLEDAIIILDYPNKSSSKFGWDYETYMLLKEKLKNKGTEKPFMAFLFTGTTHTPYAELPEKFMRFPHEKNGENGLKNTLIYADWSLGEFFRSVQTEDWFNNTIFIITADHNAGKYEKTTFPEDYHVPFLIYSPLLKGGKISDNVTSHIDITPTIIGLTGTEMVGGGYFGRSVFCKDSTSFAVISEWNAAGIAAKNAALKSSFRRVLESTPADLSADERERLEKALLAYYQVEFRRVFRGGKEK